MKKIILLVLVVVEAISVKAQETVINDPNAIVRSVAPFTAIEVSSAIDVYLSQSNTVALAVSAKEVENRNNIKTEVSNGVLKIWYDNKGGKWGKGDKKLKVYVGIKILTRIKSSGSSDVYVNGKLTGDLLELNFSGASDFKGEIAYKKLQVKISGASDASFRGSADVLEVDASGASDFKGYDLLTERCSVHASGASSIQITVNKELNAKASGASDIFYKGSGVIKDLQSSGVSSVVKKD